MCVFMLLRAFETCATVIAEGSTNRIYRVYQLHDAFVYIFWKKWTIFCLKHTPLFFVHSPNTNCFRQIFFRLAENTFIRQRLEMFSAWFIQFKTCQSTFVLQGIQNLDSDEMIRFELILFVILLLSLTIFGHLLHSIVERLYLVLVFASNVA